MDRTPREVDRLVAGAQWRDERRWDRAVMIMAAIAGKDFDPAQVIGRAVGETRVPGYRPGDKRGG